MNPYWHQSSDSRCVWKETCIVWLQVHLLSVEKHAGEGTLIKSTSCTCASNLHIDTLKHFMFYMYHVRYIVCASQ